MNSMNAKNKPRRHGRTTGEGRVFTTVDEVMSYFLPRKGVQRHVPSGKELGVQVSERTFAGLSGSKSAPTSP